jgi:hypothetical protein
MPASSEFAKECMDAVLKYFSDSASQLPPQENIVVYIPDRMLAMIRRKCPRSGNSSQRRKMRRKQARRDAVWSPLY